MTGINPLALSQSKGAPPGPRPVWVPASPRRWLTGWEGSGVSGQRIGSIAPPGVGPSLADPLSAGWVGRW
jgi:hypothetical protein